MRAGGEIGENFLLVKIFAYTVLQGFNDQGSTNSIHMQDTGNGILLCSLRLCIGLKTMTMYLIKIQELVWEGDLPGK